MDTVIPDIMSFMIFMLCKWHHECHILTLNYITESVALICGSHKTSVEGFVKIMGFNKMTDCNLGPGDNQLVTSTGRVRGLLAVWEEARRRKDRIWLIACLTPGHGRATTLALLSEMVVQKLSEHQILDMGRGLAGITSNTNDTSPSLGRARSRNPRPHPHVETPLCLPYSWPQCLCKCRCDLPPQPDPPCADPPQPDPLVLSQTKFNETGPPSLDTVSGPDSPQSGYEASNLASTSD